MYGVLDSGVTPGIQFVVAPMAPPAACKDDWLVSLEVSAWKLDATEILFIALVESCINSVPVKADEGIV